MAVNIDPIFPVTPQTEHARISTANTNRDGTGTIVDVYTAGANGSRVDKVILQGIGTTAAGVIRLFYYDGTNYRLFFEQLVSAITPSGTVIANYYSINNTDGTPICYLPVNCKLSAAPNNSETWEVYCLGGDY